MVRTFQARPCSMNYPYYRLHKASAPDFATSCNSPPAGIKLLARDRVADELQIS